MRSTPDSPTNDRPLPVGTPQPFLHLLEVDAAEVDDYPQAIEQLRDGCVNAIIIRNMYSSDFMKTVVERLARHDPPFLKTWFPEKFRSWFYGRNLNLLETDAATYFEEARAFHDQLSELFSGSWSLDGHLLKMLSRLDGDRPYRAAPGPEPGQHYMVTTLRGHGEHGYIPPHCDNEQSLRPAFEHLQTIVTPHMYSLVLLIGEATRGGTLEVFDYRVEPEQARLLSDDGVTDKPDISVLSSYEFSLQAGDAIVLDSGRFLHRVTPVVGDAVRWAACSFMAHSRERNAVYCWG